MTDKLRYWVKEIGLMVAVGAAVLFAVGWLQTQKQRGRGGDLPVGTPAPDFTLEDVASGRRVTLSELRGEPVALAFWATYCGPCRSELPGLERVHRASAGRYAVLTISAEAPETVRDFIADRAFTFPALSDATGAVHQAYGVSTVPMTVLIDAQGAIVHDFTGAADPEILAERLEALAAGR